MAWFSGKVSLGNFPDLAGAVNKLSESVKNIEKNFDSALGLQEKDASSSSNEESGLWPLPTDRKALFEPIMGFMGQKNEESTVEENKANSSQPTSPMKDKQVEKDDFADHLDEGALPKEEIKEDLKEEVESQPVDIQDFSGGQDESSAKGQSEVEVISASTPVEVYEDEPLQTDITKPKNSIELEEKNEEKVPIPDSLVPKSASPAGQLQTEAGGSGSQIEATESMPTVDDATSAAESKDAGVVEDEDIKQVLQAQILDTLADSHHGDAEDVSVSNLAVSQLNDVEPPEAAVASLLTVQNDQFAESIDMNQPLVNDGNVKEQRLSTESNSSDMADSLKELEKVKKEMKMMETALLGAARQAQAKADEIATLMNENELLKAVIDELKRKTNEAEIESLREEYHQRVAALERKVYALTKERDTLRREQNKKSDAAALLKEKDEIISQVMAEGEELSKKQAAQEATIRKLRAQVRELEEEKKGLLTKLQVEENRAESIKKDKAATEKLLQETVEKHQIELSSQKEYYTNALNQAKEAEALAQALANSEARTELEVRLREAEDRESMLVQTLEELRQTLSRKEQQAVFREDMLRRDIEDLQKRYQASERRCEELIIQVPDSTRPLLRQIEAMKESSSRQAAVWAAVEESFNSRLQEAEAKAAAAEEKERSINERLTQTLSRINVLEAQISCLRAEQTQLARSLEKERQRAAENRQEYLALKEEADTKEVRVNQLEEEIRELKRKYKEELNEAMMHRELLQKELDREKTARLEQERAASRQAPAIPDQNPITRHNSAPFENGLTRKLSSAGSLRSVEESYFLQTTLDTSDNFSERGSVGEGTMSPYYMKSMTSNTLEAALRQKEGELASYMSRLASMESIRDSLAEELVKLTAQCEKLRAEAGALPGIRAELEALRRRHSAALELMGERDEELEELRADIIDMKDMYREQVNLLVNKIQNMSSSMAASS